MKPQRINLPPEPVLEDQHRITRVTCLECPNEANATVFTRILGDAICQMLGVYF